MVQPKPNPANGILKNPKIAGSLKYLSNFLRSLRMPLINYKIESKLKWKKNCVLSEAGNDNETNNDANANRISFTIKDTKLYVPVVTLSARDNQKLSKPFGKGIERLVYWNGCKTKSENKNTTNEYRCFIKPNFVGVNVLFALVYTNEDDNAKRLKLEDIIYRKV